MKLRFDYYTNDVAALTEVMTIAADLQLDDFTINRTTNYASDDESLCWNVMGQIDHSELTELFDAFERSFVDEMSQL